MAETHEALRVAVNVMRARLTILGFNLAIITFQINELRILGGGIKLPAREHAFHLSAAAALFLGNGPVPFGDGLLHRLRRLGPRGGLHSLVSLLRSTYGRRITGRLAPAYLMLLLLVGQVWVTALILEVQRPALDGAVRSWLGGLAAPLLS